MVDVDERFKDSAPLFSKVAVTDGMARSGANVAPRRETSEAHAPPRQSSIGRRYFFRFTCAGLLSMISYSTASPVLRFSSVMYVLSSS